MLILKLRNHNSCSFVVCIRFSNWFIIPVLPGINREILQQQLLGKGLLEISQKKLEEKQALKFDINKMKLFESTFANLLIHEYTGQI